MTEKPILLEVFTNSEEENDALKMINHLTEDTKGKLKAAVKSVLLEVQWI